MNSNDQLYLDIALERGMIDARTAIQISEEIDMMPGMKPGALLVRKGFINKDQHAQIVAQLEQPTMQRMRAMGATGQTSAIKTTADPSPAATRDPGASSDALRRLMASPLPKPPQNAPLAQYLDFARRTSCSDLHMSPGRPPFVRYCGVLHYLDHPPLDDIQCERHARSVLTPDQQQILERDQQVDFALSIDNQGRYRGHIYRQQWGYDTEFRIIPNTVPTIESLGLPPGVAKLTEYHHGLVIVTGPSGSGKTTTVAALLNHINHARHEHIITVEQPIEYVIPSQNCMVSQREVGPHTDSFGTALRAALRQDPDVIFVGDMRDLETTTIAIAAAETGHLVLGTLHTGLASRAVARIVDIFPAGMREQMALTVAESMRGVIAQQLIPRKDGQGMVLAVEVLIFTPGVAQAVKESKSHLLVTLMQAGKKVGMQMMDDSLMHLVQTGVINGIDAYHRAVNKNVFETLKES